jgi:hypothetical protein
MLLLRPHTAPPLLPPLLQQHLLLVLLLLLGVCRCRLLLGGWCHIA